MGLRPFSQDTRLVPICDSYLAENINPVLNMAAASCKNSDWFIRVHLRLAQQSLRMRANKPINWTETCATLGERS